jgi:hypothetical protein
VPLVQLQIRHEDNNPAQRGEAGEIVAGAKDGCAASSMAG